MTIGISHRALTFKYAQFGTLVPEGMSIGYLSISCVRTACRISTTLRTDCRMDIWEQLELQEDQLIGNKRLVKPNILDTI
jgi:hypothetical protein